MDQVSQNFDKRRSCSPRVFANHLTALHYQTSYPTNDTFTSSHPFPGWEALNCGTKSDPTQCSFLGEHKEAVNYIILGKLFHNSRPFPQQYGGKRPLTFSEVKCDDEEKDKLQIKFKVLYVLF